MRVLVVEANPVSQQVLTLLLQRAGHDVERAGNGPQALEAFEKHTFDLILMSVALPQMDGLRATRLIRAREKVTGGRVPIIALTDQAQPAERQRCLAAGMDDCLLRPVRSPDLFAAIARLIGEAGKEQQAASTPGKEAQPEWTSPLREGNFPPEALVALVETFVGTIPDRLQALRQAVADEDARQIEKEAHSLKGALGAFSAQAATQAAASLERAGREQRLDQVPETFADLDARTASVLASMREFLQRSRRP